jgi:hypothetical protein
MDILNFISWIKGGRIVTSVDPSQTLLPVGLKDNRRDDKYLAGAISVQNLVTQITSEPAYKVYTALLTQSGGDNPLSIDTGLLTIGVTYMIATSFTGDDFSNVGGPKITFDDEGLGTYFIATGTTPANWTNETEFEYNTGAPVVTVLENTIGNVWFTYQVVGSYVVNSDGLFTYNKTIGFITYNNCCTTGLIDKPFLALNSIAGVDYVGVSSALDGIDSDDVIKNTPIEIRVYN